MGERHGSVLLWQVDDGAWSSGWSGGAWLPHPILPWVAFLSLGPLFSFWTLGSGHALSSREARESRGPVCTNLSLGPCWPSYSRIPLDSRQARGSLQPVSASGWRPEGSPGAFHVVKPCSQSWSWGPGGAGGPWWSCWSRRSCQAVLPRSTNGAGVPLGSLRSWGARFAEAAFLAGFSWSPIFSWNTRGSLGARDPRAPVPPRHTGEACGS